MFFCLNHFAKNENIKRARCFSFRHYRTHLSCFSFSMTANTVAVIGAGASGLIVAKILIQDGFDVTIFDREKHLGGIWSPDQAYLDLQTQISAGFMEYSDLPNTEGIYS